MYATKEREYQVIIADDHPVFTLGVKALLNTLPEIAVVGQSYDGLQALELVKAHEPAIAILDNDMPGMTGIELARYICRHKIETRVVILTYHIDAEMLNEMKHCGVFGVMLKQSALEEMGDCLNDVLTGKKYISDTCKEYVKNANLEVVDNGDQEKIELLTNAEIKVLKLIADNMSSQQIAEAMFVSPKTIKNHRYNICKKLAITGNNSLLSFALKNRYLLLQE